MFIKKGEYWDKIDGELVRIPDDEVARRIAKSKEAENAGGKTPPASPDAPIAPAPKKSEIAPANTGPTGFVLVDNTWVDNTKGDYKRIAKKSRTRTILRRLSGLALILLLAWLIGIGLGSCSKQNPTTKWAINNPTSAPTSVPNPLFRQVPGDNSKSKVYAKFSEKFEKALKKTKSVSKAAKLTLLENSANNAHRLAIWANAMGLYNNPNDFQRLLTEKGDYLSKEGIALFYKMKKALNAEGTKLGIANAPTNGFNSYVDSKGNFVIAESKGIKGNRKAIELIFREGKNGKIILKVKILLRCGNTVYEKWIVIPLKPKPTPTPKPTPWVTPKPTPWVTPRPTPRPTPTLVPTPQPTPTLKPKGDDWYYTTPKPTAQPIVITPDIIPPKVVTPAPKPTPLIGPKATPNPTQRPILPPEETITSTALPNRTPPPNSGDPGNTL